MPEKIGSATVEALCDALFEYHRQLIQALFESGHYDNAEDPGAVRDEAQEAQREFIETAKHVGGCAARYAVLAGLTAGIKEVLLSLANNSARGPNQAEMHLLMMGTRKPEGPLN